MHFRRSRCELLQVLAPIASVGEATGLPLWEFRQRGQGGAHGDLYCLHGFGTAEPRVERGFGASDAVCWLPMVAWNSVIRKPARRTSLTPTNHSTRV
jgi:hypothetical protein